MKIKEVIEALSEDHGVMLAAHGHRGTHLFTCFKEDFPVELFGKYEVAELISYDINDLCIDAIIPDKSYNDFVDKYGARCALRAADRNDKYYCQQFLDWWYDSSEFENVLEDGDKILLLISHDIAGDINPEGYEGEEE